MRDCLRAKPLLAAPFGLAESLWKYIWFVYDKKVCLCNLFLVLTQRNIFLIILAILINKSPYYNIKNELLRPSHSELLAKNAHDHDNMLCARCDYWVRCWLILSLAEGKPDQCVKQSKKFKKEFAWQLWNRSPKEDKTAVEHTGDVQKLFRRTTEELIEKLSINVYVTPKRYLAFTDMHKDSFESNCACIDMSRRVQRIVLTSSKKQWGIWRNEKTTLEGSWSTLKS